MGWVIQVMAMVILSLKEGGGLMDMITTFRISWSLVKVGVKGGLLAT